MAQSIQPGRFGRSGKPDDAWLAKQEKEPILELAGGKGIRTAGPSRNEKVIRDRAEVGIDDSDPVNGGSNQPLTLRILWMRYGPGCRARSRLREHRE